MTTWILVSDASRAKLYETELREDRWRLLDTIEHAGGHQRSSEIRPGSPPGRMQQSRGHGARHTALQPHTTPKEADEQRFALLLAERLEHATAERRFDALVLVAPPRFLGVLHAALGRQASNLLRNTVHKDLSMLGLPELQERLNDAVFASAEA